MQTPMNSPVAAENEPVGSHAAPSPLEAFTGTIEPSEPSLFYKGGLACVAFAMVLLPTIYIGLILLAAYGVLWHLQHNLWIMDGRGGGVGKLIGYLGPAVVGGTLVVFMVKPFFAKPAKKRDPISLDPAKEPLLFAFIQKICTLVGAPMPARVDVDCQVNASASFRRGLLSNDLVLTIGLPLASGLDMRQFAGVLAHEFGHFAQGAGMRLTYVVRSVNHWFARVVYERDGWDVSLEQTAKGIDLRIGIILHAARGCIWLTRRILWALMHAGNALSCFMLRQMEYDADSYEAKVAGSDVFQPTSVALQRLNMGLHMTMEDVRQSWTSKRLPENVPMLVQHRTAHMSGNMLEKLDKTLSEQKTGVFDTHPCDADRAKAVRALNEPGVFRLTEPATRLFSDFNETGKRVTEALYKHDAELEFSEENLISSEQALQETTANAQAEEAIHLLYGKVNISIFPLVTDDHLPSLTDARPALVDWKEACSSWKESLPGAETISEERSGMLEEQIKFQAIQHLLEAYFKLEPKPFGLPEHATSMAEQGAVVHQRLSEIKAKLDLGSPEFEQFVNALRHRVTSALSLLQSSEFLLEQKAELNAEVQTLLPILRAVAKTLPALHEMAPSMRGYTMLLENRSNHSQPERVDAEIERVAASFRVSLRHLEGILAGHSYPFSHAKGQLSLRDYAKSEETSEIEWIQIFYQANSHLDKLFTLHFRLVGRLAAIVLLIEKQIEIEARGGIAP